MEPLVPLVEPDPYELLPPDTPFDEVAGTFNRSSSWLICVYSVRQSFALDDCDDIDPLVPVVDVPDGGNTPLPCCVPVAPTWPPVALLPPLAALVPLVA